MNITVKYSCVMCGVRRKPLAVPAREPLEDVIEWTNYTVLLVHQDHRLSHPDCRETKLSELMIPIDNVERVGGPPVS